MSPAQKVRMRAIIEEHARRFIALLENPATDKPTAEIGVRAILTACFAWGSKEIHTITPADLNQEILEIERSYTK